MSLFANDREKKANKMRGELNALLEQNNARLINFEYYYKIFGNIIVEIEYKDIIHKFVTDKGEISYNKRFICDNSYHIAGKSDTFEMLVKVIKKELF